MSIAETLETLNSVTVETLSGLSHDLVHTIALGHPNSEISDAASKLDVAAAATATTASQSEKITEFRNKFRANLAVAKDVVFSDGTVMKSTDDALYDKIGSTATREDRRTAFLAYENAGWPENVQVISDLLKHVPADHADKQAIENGFENASAVRHMIDEYWTSIKPRYDEEFSLAAVAYGTTGKPLAHWDRSAAFAAASSKASSEAEPTFTVAAVLDAFCSLWTQFLGVKHMSWYARSMWGTQQMYVFNIVTPGDHTAAILVNLCGKGRGIATHTAPQLSYVSLPFGHVSELTSTQIQRLFHELGHGVHHATAVATQKQQMLEVPSTFMERLLCNAEIVREIGLNGLVVKPPSAHSAASDICYSIYCLDLFGGGAAGAMSPIVVQGVEGLSHPVGRLKQSREAIYDHEAERSDHKSMSPYYDLYFPGYTREGYELHTECNLRQIVTYQSAYYLYILADATVEKMVKAFNTDRLTFVPRFWDFLVRGVI